MVDVMINENVSDVTVLQLLIPIAFPLGIYGLYCCFAAMRHRKPSHPYFLSIYAPASEFTEVGARYRKRYFFCLKVLFALGAIPIILKIVRLI